MSEPTQLEVAAANYTRSPSKETYEVLCQAARDFVNGEVKDTDATKEVKTPAKKSKKS